MKLILDTNLLFSSISKPDGKIAEIILNQHLTLECVGCYFSFIELFRYKEKLIKISKLEEQPLLEAMYLTLKRIHFYNEGLISENTFNQAYKLTKDIDPKDTIFIAMSLHLGIKLWTGDLQLAKGLRNKGYSDILLTNELLQIFKGM